MSDVNKVITRVLFRSDTTENWASKDPVLALGEIGVEYEDIYTDSEGNEVGVHYLDPEGKPQFLHKVGNGKDTWSNLLYSSASPKHTVDTIIPPLSDVPASTKAVYDFQEIKETDEPLDSLVETGVFIVTDSILETDTEMYKVQVFKNGNFILQECRSIEGSGFFTRFKKEGVWSEWESSGLLTDLPDYLQPSMTGSATLNGTTNNTVQLTDIVTTLGLEVGDVIRIQYSGYDKLHTVESITDDNSIIVNYEHAGNRADGSLKLPNTTTTATITRICKWYNAPIGLGQAWVDVTGSRSQGTTYTNQTGRLMVAIVLSSRSAGGSAYVTVGEALFRNGVSGEGVATGVHGVTLVIPNGSTYLPTSLNILQAWTELR